MKNRNYNKVILTLFITLNSSFVFSQIFALDTMSLMQNNKDITLEVYSLNLIYLEFEKAIVTGVVMENDSSEQRLKVGDTISVVLESDFSKYEFVLGVNYVFNIYDVRKPHFKVVNKHGRSVAEIGHSDLQNPCVLTRIKSCGNSAPFLEICPEYGSILWFCAGVLGVNQELE